MRIMLDGCDISLIADVSEDMSVSELVAMCDHIALDYCACGIRSLREDEDELPVDVVITRDYIAKISDGPFQIVGR